MRKPVIYVVDDDNSVRTALTRLLSAEGYAARPYASAEDFLLGIGDLEDGCMILDINMPGANGFELQQLLVAKDIRLPIIFLTGSGDVAVGHQGMTSAAADFLGKPVDGEVLLTAIQRALSRKR